eukprot:2152235-Rhodomonas_salina.1
MRERREELRRGLLGHAEKRTTPEEMTMRKGLHCWGDEGGEANESVSDTESVRSDDVRIADSVSLGENKKRTSVPSG